MEIVVRGLVYFIVSLIIMIIFVFIVKKMEEREKKQQEQGATVSGIVLKPKQVESDIEKELNNIKKETALKTIKDFIKRSDSISPIKLINDVNVTIVSSEDCYSIYTAAVEFRKCLKIQYSLNSNLYEDYIYVDRMFAAGGPAVYNYKRYTLSELEDSNWIIDEIYRLVERRRNILREENFKDLSFKHDMENHKLIKKINQ